MKQRHFFRSARRVLWAALCFALLLSPGLKNPTPTTARAGLGTDLGTETMDSQSVAWGDWDGDGAPDLGVANYGEANQAHRNEGTPGTWRDTFDDDDGLGVEKNTLVRQGTLSLGLDDTWVQTTQQDFEAGTIDRETLDTATTPGTLRLLTRPIVFTANVRVDDADTGAKYNPTDANGNVYAVWQDVRNGYADIYFSRSIDGGITWSPNVRINDDTGAVSQLDPAIAVDGDGNAYAVWWDERNGDWDIYFSRSTDGGVTWSPNVRVNDDTGSAWQTHPAIAVDGDGNVYAVWADSRNGNYDIYFSRSTDGGLAWNPDVRVDDDTGAAYQRYPSVAIDGDGNAYAVWQDDRNGNYDIYFSRSTDDGLTWSPDVRVDNDTGAAYQQYPSIAVGGDGDAYAVWQDDRNDYEDIYFSRSTDGGVTWSPNVRVNDDTGVALQMVPIIAVDADGNAYTVWEDYRNGDTDIYFSHSTDGGVTWSPNVRVNDDTGAADQVSPVIAVDRGGNAYAVWHDRRPGEGGIYFARSLPGTGTTYFDAGAWTSAVYNAGGGVAWADITWTATTPVSTAITFQTRTGDIPTPDHTWSNWSDAYTVSGETITSPAARYIQVNAALFTNDVYTTPALLEMRLHYRPHLWTQTNQADFEAGSVDWLDIASAPGDVTLLQLPVFGTNVKVNDDTGTADQVNPTIGVDGDGNAYTVWQDHRDSVFDIYFSRSTDGGLTWSPDMRVDDDTGATYQYDPSVAVDGGGNAFAVWKDYRNGDWDIYFSRSTDGGITWSPNARINDDTGAAYQRYPAIAVDGDGIAYAVWEDTRNGEYDYDIYFSHSTDGGVTWSPNVRVNDDPGGAHQHQLSPAIAVDGDGNAYVVWGDGRNGNNYNIYFSRSADEGVTWSPNVRINDDTGSASQSYPALAVGGGGNIYTVWRDDRSGNLDIYFSCSTDGGVTWSPNVRVNDATVSPVYHVPAYLVIAVDGESNAYTMWEDKRNGNWDIYFSHSTDGGVTWSPNVPVNDDTGSARQLSPAGAVDGDGSTYAVWEDRRNGNDDIYFARSLPGITYASIGVLTSPVHDTAGIVVWGHITWTVTTPPSTTIVFQTRTGDTATPDEDWSQWSAVYASPGLTITSPLSRYLQYQAVLSTTDPYTTPVLHDVTLDWKQYASSGWATSVPITPSSGFLRWNNLYFTADAPGHTSLSVDVLSITGTVLIPGAANGDSLHTIDPVVHPAIRLRANLVRSLDPTQTPHLDEWMVTWYPPPPDQHVRVFDEGGTPVDDARVYQNGNLIGSTDELGVFGFYPPTHTLNISDSLVALALVSERPSFREAHQTPDSAQNWAFRTNVTNIEVTDDGTIHTHVVTQTGQQLLTVDKSNSLILFNLVVSIEWDATITYTRQISRAAQYASDYLYDLSDGQMAFGHVDVYDNAKHWADADIQVSTKNIVRPHAYIGGITSEDTSHVIRVGRGWDGASGSQGPWDEPDGYRTLGHEFGHYALHLYDEYFAYLFDPDGNLLGEVPAYCTGPENRDPATDATNASAMDHQYTTSELSARDVPGLWSDLCEQTAQWQLNSESAWETLARAYTDTTTPPRWQLTTPIDRGNVLAGPEGLRPDLPAWPLIEIHQGGSSAPTRHLTVYDAQGPYWGAQVALYTNQGGHPVAIDQGFTDQLGEIEIYGAQGGDTLRVASLDGALSGSVSVTDALTYTLVIAPPARMRALAIPGLNPYLTLRPSGDGDTLFMRLSGLGPGGTLAAIVTSSGGTDSQATALAYSSAEEAYVGSVAFAPGMQLGTGTVQVIGAGVGSQGLSLNSTYALHAIPRDRAADLYSADGNLHVHLITGTIPVDAYAVLSSLSAVPAQPPGDLQVVGNAYDVGLSGALLTLDKPALLKLHYDGALVSSSSAPEGLGVYRWDPNGETWQAVPGELDERQRAVVAPVTALGTYALLESPPAQNLIFLPLILKGAPEFRAKTE